MPYSAPLDGIRAIAILAVLLFHISPSALKGGFTGVDVFFVLSGFLITSIILHDLRDGNFSIREFYLRRVQRLLPNVVVTVLAVLLLWTIFLPASMAIQAGRHGLWTIANLSNIYIWRNLGGYWGEAAEWAPLTHTWSLGIEEQFYLLFPAGLVLLARFQPKRVLVWLAALTVLSLGLYTLGCLTYPTATFYLLPTRVWELLIGAVLAAHLTPLASGLDQPRPVLSLLSVKVQEAIGLSGLGMIILGFIFINDGSEFAGLPSLVPTVGTVFILLSIVTGQTRLSRLLSSSFMVGTGKLSYSLYLWHWPLITLGKILANFYGISQLYGAIAGGAAGILLAWGAYTWVEQPLRKRGSGRSWRFAVIAALFLSVAVSAVSVASRHPVVDPAHRFDMPSFYGVQFNAGKPQVDPSPAKAIRFSDVYFPPPPVRQNDPWRTGGILHLYGGGQPKIVVLGSSHALMYSRLIDDICREMGISVAFLGMDYGTPAFFKSKYNPNFSSPQEAHEFDVSRRNYIQQWRPEAVFVIDRWDLRIDSPLGFEKDLRSFLVEVSPFAHRVLFVAQVPVLRGGKEVNQREMVTWRMGKGNSLPRLNPDRNEPLRKETAAVAEADTKDFPNLRVIRADQLFYREDGSVRYESGRTFFYADDDHLTDKGSEVARGLFRSAIAEAHSK